jgi:hypothetical protein
METQTALPEGVERLLQAGAPVSALVPYFATKREALVWFAAYQQALYHYDSEPAACTCCQKPIAELRMAFRWQTWVFAGLGFGALEALLLFVGHIGVRLRQEVFSFQTVHPVCTSCWRKVRLRHMVASLLDGLVLLGIIVGLFLAGIGIPGAFFLKLKPDEWWGYLATGFLGCALVGGAAALKAIAKRMHIPVPLRRLNGGRFFCHSVSLATGPIVKLDVR